MRTLHKVLIYLRIQFILGLHFLRLFLYFPVVIVPVVNSVVSALVQHYIRVIYRVEVLEDGVALKLGSLVLGAAAADAQLRAALL